MNEVNVSRLLFSALESGKASGSNFDLKARLMNSTTGGNRGLGGLTRMDTYAQVCSNFDELMNRANKKARFTNSASSYADSADAVGQISVGVDATIRAYVDSMAGFLCREESINAPNALVNIFDAYDAFDDTIISPNLGRVNVNKLRDGRPVSAVQSVTPGTALSYTIAGGKVIPGSLRVRLTTVTGTKDSASVTVNVDDIIQGGITLIDQLGSILAAPGLLTAGTIDYATGAVSLNVVAATLATMLSLDTVTGLDVVIEACIDMTRDAASTGVRTHIKGKTVGFLVTTAPELLTYEANLIENISVSKTLGSDMQVYLSERLAELYTIRINTMIAEAIDNNYEGDTKVINFSTVSFDNTRSYSDYFYNKIIEIGQAAKEKVYRLGNPNVVLTGLKGLIPFLKLTSIGVFTRVKSSNVVGLNGYLDDVTPVLSTDIIKEDPNAVNPQQGGENGEGIFYFGFKSSDGTVAPLLRVIYLPLTTTPNVGNFDNPVQVSGGYYYAEACYTLYKEALQRVQVFGFSKY